MTQRHISHPESLPACAAGKSTLHINGAGKRQRENHS